MNMIIRPRTPSSSFKSLHSHSVLIRILGGCVYVLFPSPSFPLAAKVLPIMTSNGWNRITEDTCPIPFLRFQLTPEKAKVAMKKQYLYKYVKRLFYLPLHPSLPKTAVKPSLVPTVSHKMAILLCGVYPDLVSMFTRPCEASSLGPQATSPTGSAHYSTDKDTHKVTWAAQAGSSILKHIISSTFYCSAFLTL